MTKLTLRQRTALYLVGEGYCSKRIAAAMGVSAFAADNQVRVGAAKLRAKNRTHAAVMLRGIE